MNQQVISSAFSKQAVIYGSFPGSAGENIGAACSGYIYGRTLKAPFVLCPLSVLLAHLYLLQEKFSGLEPGGTRLIDAITAFPPRASSGSSKETRFRNILHHKLCLISPGPLIPITRKKFWGARPGGTRVIEAIRLL
jgi:hypothetical protein